jgi:hypothetical protein
MVIARGVHELMFHEPPVGEKSDRSLIRPANPASPPKEAVDLSPGAA